MKHTIHFILLKIFILSINFSGHAQELSANVEIDGSQVNASNQQVFEEMEQSFTDFLNQRNWTDDEFKVEERIACNFIITITEASNNSYKATVQIQSSRPVYNTDYQTLILNFADQDWNFQYTPSQPLNFNENTFSSNITSILGFYAYVIIGMDYDSFSELGGDDELDQAQQIVSNAQQSGGPGWDQFESNQNRYWLINDILNEQLSPMRVGSYEYHRLGLDKMSQNKEEARKNILECLKKVQKAYDRKPNAVLLNNFFNAKNDELIKIFSEGDQQVRREAYNILNRVNPKKSSDYEKILEN